MPRKHYTPPLSRFLVCALFHEAKVRGIPMTRLANNLMEAALRESPGWKQAQAQQETMRMGEGVTKKPALRIGQPQLAIDRRRSSLDPRRLEAALTGRQDACPTSGAFRMRIAA